MWFQNLCFFYYIIAGYTSNTEKKEHQEVNILFKPVVAAQKINKVADPKSVIYMFFMQEQCTKGEKCKFYFWWENVNTHSYIDFGDKNFIKVVIDDWD